MGGVEPLMTDVYGGRGLSYIAGEKAKSPTMVCHCFLGRLGRSILGVRGGIGERERLLKVPRRSNLFLSSCHRPQMRGACYPPPFIVATTRSRCAVAGHRTACPSAFRRRAPVARSARTSRCTSPS